MHPSRQKSCHLPKTQLSIHASVDVVWSRILTAPTSSAAVQRALLALPANPFPQTVIEDSVVLPPWIQRNVACIVRVCQHLIPGDPLRAIRFSDTRAKRIVESGLKWVECHSTKRKQAGEKRKRETRNVEADEAEKKRCKKRIKEEEGEKDSLSAENSQAKTLAAWARDTQALTTTGPPKVALEALQRAADPRGFLEFVFVKGLSDEAVGVLTEHLLREPEQRVVSALVQVLMCRINKLKRVAPRVLVSCVLKASKINGSAVVNYVFDNGMDVGDIAGEVVSKVVRECLSGGVAEVVLRRISQLNWGSGGVRIMQELVTKCSKEIGEDTLAVLIDGLDRNVESRERCLNFAKLLWMVVQKYRTKLKMHNNRLMRILRCSQVFLAKRALETLRMPN